MFKHIKGIGINTIGLGFYYISVYANLFILNNLLPGDDFGNLQMTIAASYILSAVVMGGMQSYLAINLCKSSKYDTTIYRTIISSILIRYLFIFLMVLLLSYYGISKIIAFIMLLSLGVTLNLLVDSIFINFDDVRLLAIRKFAGETVVFCICITIYLQQVPVNTLKLLVIYSACYLIVGIIFVAISFRKLEKLGNELISETQELTSWSIQKLAMPYFIWTIIQAAIGRGSILFVGYAFGATNAGLWRLFQSGIQGAQSIASAALSVVVPKEVRDNSEKILVNEIYSKKVLVLTIFFAVILSIITFLFYYYFLISDLQSQSRSMNLLVLNGLLVLVMANTYYAIVSTLLHWTHEVRSFLQQQLILLILTIILFLTLYTIELYIDLSSFVFITILMVGLATARIASTFHAVNSYEYNQS